jgi:dipeptidyl aminopeptidase/acylaminoacyl peptidase
MTIMRALLSAAVVVSLSALAAGPEVVTRTANDGNLVMEDVPPIPAEVASALNRYQNVRSAAFRDWTADGRGMYVTTRFADVRQIHRIDQPGGARHQMTFNREPVGTITRQPGGDVLLFTRDAGGGEFSQIFLFDLATGDAEMLTDGESRNSAVTWDRDGRRIAYQSTLRNGASNDIWLMDTADKNTAEMVLESQDGSWWGPVEFSSSGRKILLENYVSIADSRASVLDLDGGRLTLLAGGEYGGGANFAVGFDESETGYWLTTDRDSEFRRLAWQPLTAGAEPEIVTANINWDVSGVSISHDRRRIAFTVNENGLSRVYLMDARTREYRMVEGIPVGTAFGLEFSPDDYRLAMTLNTPQTPSDSYVLELGRHPLNHGRLTRWSYSEVGGLDTSDFVIPKLVAYPTFDKVDGKVRKTPAWLYLPRGEGPFPVVVSIHGGPESQSRPYFSSTYQMWLNELGVAVLLPNVRGSSGFGKTYLALDNGERREDSVRDIGALLDWIEVQPELDENRVAVFGGSYGGYMVLASAVHYSERLSAAVDVVGISNFVSFLENTQDYRRDLRRQEYGDERDPQMRAHLERISPLNNVEKIRVPLLVVQGQNDPRVPVSESEQMVEALRARGQPVWYMNALNEGHGYRKKQNRDLYQQAVVMFFRRHLLPDEALRAGVQ